ncbi:hypothetical protein SFOMI_1521 [Sphingobium fuliginis]|uniref:Uncharacterized protein n=1 Tax=Sphingobium fuliginis (strain ATCC 27551) TaxID=336203 RepID=A0A292ZDL3_SPHSA|nr:hypothetical protein SFOMI_1521 [Sphingobium fuliginis]
MIVGREWQAPRLWSLHATIPAPRRWQPSSVDKADPSESHHLESAR